LGDRGIDPATGKPRPKQIWKTVRGTRKAAEKLLTDMLKAVDAGTHVDPAKLTVAAYLGEWIAATKAKWRATTLAKYEGIVRNHIAPSALGQMQLQTVRATHVEAYHASQTVDSTTHHVVLAEAFEKAERDGLVAKNPTAHVDKPQPKHRKGFKTGQDAAWSVDEVRRFLDAARAAGPQAAALYAMAIDTGARLRELAGLVWDDVDMAKRSIRFRGQLVTGSSRPTFGPTKSGQGKTVIVTPTTIELLRQHRQAQNELRMRNRSAYHDHGLVFAKDWAHVKRQRDVLGDPIAANNINARELDPLIKAAGVKRITFHGLRHTSATLLLAAGQPVHVVAARLGHSDVTTTLDTYAHALPDAQAAAADTMGGLLHGKARH
jgi:integrase